MNAVKIYSEGRELVFFGDGSRRFGSVAYPDGTFGEQVLGIGDFESAIDCFALTDECGMGDYLQVLSVVPVSVSTTEVVVDLPIALAKYGAFKFGRSASEHYFVKVRKAVEEL